MIPRPERISQWGSATEIIYSCPHCGTSLGFFGPQEHFCHNCGTKISWNIVPLHCSKEFSDYYHNDENYQDHKEALLVYVENIINHNQRRKNK